MNLYVSAGNNGLDFLAVIKLLSNYPKLVSIEYCLLYVGAIAISHLWYILGSLFILIVLNNM